MESWEFDLGVGRERERESLEYFCFNWKKRKSLKCDRKETFEKICIEIAGFSKLVSDGKCSIPAVKQVIK